MARTIESILANHERARELREQGKPIWTYQVKLRVPKDGTFEERRDAIATGLRASSWFKVQALDIDDYNNELVQLWDELKDAETVEHFDIVWDGVYDLADEDRAWITIEEI